MHMQVFYLPAQSGEKTALAIAILVSQTLYFTLVIEVTNSLLPLPPPSPSSSPPRAFSSLLLCVRDLNFLSNGLTTSC